MIISGIHAREWISPATVTYVMNNLVTNPQYDRLLDMFDFFILPVTNPDGWDIVVLCVHDMFCIFQQYKWSTYTNTDTSKSVVL